MNPLGLCLSHNGIPRVPPDGRRFTSVYSAAHRHTYTIHCVHMCAWWLTQPDAEGRCACSPIWSSDVLSGQPMKRVALVLTAVVVLVVLVVVVYLLLTFSGTPCSPVCSEMVFTSVHTSDTCCMAYVHYNTITYQYCSGKIEAHKLWSMVMPGKAAPVTGHCLEDCWPYAAGL